MPLPPALDAWLSRLRCPCCGGTFVPEDLPAGGALACRRRRWPVVHGIVVLREGRATDGALAALEKGDEETAAAILAGADLRSRADRVLERLGAWALSRSAGPGRAARRVRRRLRRASGGGFPAAVRALFGRPPWPVPAFADYLLRRRSDPTFVAAEALAVLAGPGAGPVLDLGCGVGHLLVSLAALGAGPLAGVDSLFPVLFLARRHLVPDALLVCAGAADPLPFPDGTFSRVHVVDALFDFPSVPGAAREIRRVLAGDGTAVLSHLHNRLRPHLYAGRAPLAPGEWLDALSPLDPRLIDEREVVRVAAGGGDLAPGTDPGRFRDSPDLSALGGRVPGVLRADGPVLPPPVGPWRPSPEYVAAPADGATVLRRRGAPFISEEEAGPFEGILPEEARVDGRTLEALAGGTLPGELAGLAAARVVLPVPPGLDPAIGPPGAPAPPPPRPRRAGPVRLARELRSAVRSGFLVRRLRREARARLPGGGLVILAGHRVTRRRGPDPLDLAVPARQLAGIVATLGRVGPFLAPAEALEALAGGTLPPGLSFVLTFDDGTLDLLRWGLPVLRERGIEAAVFPCGEDAAPWGRFRWDVLGEGGTPARPGAWRDVGAAVGFHGAGHRRVELLAGAELAREVAPPPWMDLPVFAFPYGAVAGVPAPVVDALRAAGYRAALTMRPGIARPGDDPYRLPRVAVHDGPVDGLLGRLLGLVRGNGKAREVRRDLPPRR